MQLTVIGCSGSMPGPESAASCYLVTADDETGRTWRVLLDLGSGALGPLQRSMSVHDIDAVLLSHLHPDHCLDLCGLYVATRYDPDRTPGRRIPVWGPTGTAERLAAAYGAEPEPGLAAVFDVTEFGHGRPVDVGPLRVTPFDALHPVPAFALRVEHPGTGTSLAYSGDTDSCPGLIEAARGVDLLLAEAAFLEGDAPRGVHLTGRRAGAAAAQAGAAALLVTHVPPWHDPAVALAAAAAAFGGPTQLAAPGLTVDVGRLPD